MAGLFYKAEIVAVSITTTPTTSDIIECLTGATNPITIHRIELTSKSVQTTEQYNIQLIKRATTGSGGSAGTVVAQMDLNTRSAALTTTLGRTTTVGTASTVYNQWDWNIVIPFDEMNGKAALEIEIPAATRFSIFLNGQTVGTRVFNGAIFFEER
jgi:hypothetical protein